MNKQEIISNFTQFCEEEISKVQLPSSNGTIQGMKTRLEVYQNSITRLNKSLTGEINLVLCRINLDSQDATEIKDELIQIAKNYIGKTTTIFNTK